MRHTISKRKIREAMRLANRNQATQFELGQLWDDILASDLKIKAKRKLLDRVEKLIELYK